MKEKRFMLALLTGIVCFGLLSTINVMAGGQKSTEAKKLRIGFTVNAMNHPYPIALEKFAKDEAAKQGVEITCIDPQGDPQRQVDMLMQFVTQGYDAIVSNPVDGNNCYPVYKAAKEAGIPVIECSNFSTGDTLELVTCYVAADQELEGKAAAEALVKLLPNGGNIVIIEGTLGGAAQIGRDKGFEDFLKDKPQYKILAKQPADWDRAKAMTIMEDFLTRFDKIDAVYGHDDVLVAGAFEAVTAAKRTGIVSVAIGASKDAIDLMKKGILTSTVDQSPEIEGRTSIQMAIKAANGEKVPKWVPDPLPILTADEIDTFTPIW
jgi:ribose transport system substrate-binding protein